MLHRILLSCCALTLVVAMPLAAGQEAVGVDLPGAEKCSTSPQAEWIATDSYGLAQSVATKGQENLGVCSAIADCWNGSTVSCSGGVGTTCSAIDSNCSSQRGYVRCGSSYTYCPSCPSCSIEGFACSSNAWCASKCDLVCGLPWGICTPNGCSCDDP